jgi:gluconolactonase
MNRHFALLLVIPVAVFAACSNKSSDDNTNAGDTPAGTDAGTPGPGASSGGTPGTPGMATPADIAKNPIEGIAAAKMVLDAGEYTDGPIWSAKDGVVYFSTPLGTSGLYRMKPDGTASKIFDGDPTTGAQPIGNTIDKNGNLFTIEAKRVTKTAVAGDAGADVSTPIATGYPDSEAGTAAFDTLNDAVVSANGTMYVTDPGYYTTPVANRIYRITPAGVVSVVDAFDDVPRPNGIALTPDGKGLYVGFSQPIQGTAPFIRKYVVNADGSLGAQAKFVDLDMDAQPDGIEVDQAGNVFVAAKAGITVFKSDATKIGVVAVPELATGMAFGGTDLKTLYITTQGTKIWQITVNVPGIVQ